jgi:glycosyltransferase involved in cell wall biosynthesis
VPIAVAVIDDNPHVRWRGRVYPVNAMFHRFLSALMDAPGRDGSPAVGAMYHCIPVRDVPDEPETLPLDDRIHVVATSPFTGIADFLARAPTITRANARILRPVIAAADLAWIKVPASNALLATWLAARARTPRFAYVAGRAGSVAAAQDRGFVKGTAARIVGSGYDAIGMLAGVRGRRIVVGRGVVTGGGIVTSPLDPDEIRPPVGPWPRMAGKLRLAWAGRIAEGKGLNTVVRAMAADPAATELVVLGDGPARDRLVDLAAALHVSDRVTWHGYVSDRRRYLDRLAGADVFAFPSPAEGFPKVILDAMAVGLPVLASPSGAISELVRARLVEPVQAGDADALVAAVKSLLDRPDRADELRSAGAAFAALHTRDAEAAKLVRLWQAAFPALPWD